MYEWKLSPILHHPSNCRTLLQEEFKWEVLQDFFGKKGHCLFFLRYFLIFFLPAFFFSKLNSQRNSLPKPCITYPLIESFQVHFLLGLCKLLSVILALDFELITDKWSTEVAIAWHFNDGHLRIEKGLSNPSCTPHCSPCTFTASNTSYTGFTTDCCNSTRGPEVLAAPGWLLSCSGISCDRHTPRVSQEPRALQSTGGLYL